MKLTWKKLDDYTAKSFTKTVNDFIHSNRDAFFGGLNSHPEWIIFGVPGSALIPLPTAMEQINMKSR